MKKKAYFCVDIGGTKTAWSFYDPDGKELVYEKFPTEPERGAGDLVARVRAGAGKVLDQYDVPAACIASPGPLDPASGKIVRIVTMGWENVEIVRLFEEAFGFRFFLLNDCDAGALGVANLPDFSAYRSVSYMSISTGIGGGVVVDGKLVAGQGNSGDFGHMPVPGEGLRCGCGRVDCLELYASGSGLEKRYFTKTGKRLSCAEVEALAKAGDPVASELFADARAKLDFGMMSLRAILDPEIVVFGGSVCRAGKLIFGDLGSRHRIGFAPDDGKQVLLGAFAYAKQREMTE